MNSYTSFAPMDLLSYHPPLTSQSAIHSPQKAPVHPHSIVTEVPNPPELEAETSRNGFLESLSKDDKDLFDNCDRFLRGEIDQEQFQALSFKRLLFIWDWVLHLCFNNRSLAIKAWYEILEKENIWQWDDDDECQCPRRLDNIWALGWNEYEDCNGLDQLCDPPKQAIQGAMEVLRRRLRSKWQSSQPSQLEGLLQPASGFIHSPRLKSLLQSHKPQLRYFAIIWIIATSNTIRVIDESRGISGRTVRSLFSEMNFFGLDSSLDPAFHPSWRNHMKTLEDLGHTDACDNNEEFELGLLFELLDIVNPQYRAQRAIEGYCCKKCEESGPLLLSEITPLYHQRDLSEISTHTPPKYLRFLWRIWMRRDDGIPCLTDVGAWLDWLASLARETIIPRSTYPTSTQTKGMGAARVIAYLRTAQMDEWVIPQHLSTCLADSIFGSEWAYDRRSEHRDDVLAMRVPTQHEWKMAEETIELATPYILDPKTESVLDYRAVIGVILCWMDGWSVASPFPDTTRFTYLLGCFDSDCDWPPTPPLPTDSILSLKRRILDKQPSCCDGIIADELEGGNLDLYFASATLIGVTFSDETISKCSYGCKKTSREKVRVKFKACVSRHWGMSGRDEVVGELLNDMIRIAVKGGVNRDALLRRINRDGPEKIHAEIQTDYPVGTSAKKSGKDLNPSQQPEIQKRISKSSQVEVIKTHIVKLLTELELATGRIPVLIPRKNQQPSLPWKTLIQILSERGYELENWPSAVPLPGSGSEHCDDNKDVHGLNARHLRLLYDATRNKEQPLRFRMVSAHVLSEGPAGRWTDSGARAREEREDDDMPGPSKRGRVEEGNQGSGSLPFYGLMDG